MKNVVDIGRARVKRLNKELQQDEYIEFAGERISLRALAMVKSGGSLDKHFTINEQRLMIIGFGELYEKAKKLAEANNRMLQVIEEIEEELDDGKD